MTDMDPYVSSGAHADRQRTLTEQCIGDADESAEIIAQLASEPIIFDIARSDAARDLAGDRGRVVHDAY